MVGIIMGSRSDWETMSPARDTLAELQIPCEVRVVSAHRMPDEMFEYASTAAGRGLVAIIAGAGGAAHLPGMTAAKTLVPVIGVPVSSKASGLDSLLSIAQMPPWRPGCDDGDRRGGQRGALCRAHRRAPRFRCRRAACRLHDAHARRGRLQRFGLKRIKTIGVIGGGQLGRMFALDAKRMGYHVITLDPQEHSPCGQIADEQIIAAYSDLGAIEELGRRSDVITYEFENIDIASVRHLESLSHRVAPSSSVLLVTQNRLREKEFLRDAGLATTEFARVAGLRELEAAAERIGFPAILKTVRRRLRRQGSVAGVVARRGPRRADGGARRGVDLGAARRSGVRAQRHLDAQRARRDRRLSGC